jgi:hypothetical protein
MPHWNGVVNTSSPPILKSSKGDPVSVREKLMRNAPSGANVRTISWEKGKDVARITVEGPKAEEFLRKLEARNIVELVSAWERKVEKDEKERKEQERKDAKARKAR